MVNRISVFFQNPSVRRWLYGLAIAGFGVLGVYGLLTPERIAAWSLFASALFGLAFLNTPAPREPGRHAADVDEDDDTLPLW